MTGSECIILVPGLFGFGKIGNVTYFAEVEDILSKATGIATIVSLEPPPTGPLWRRVDCLYREVTRRVNGGASRIHLVGHSTGGVDIRLLSNSRYLWPGGPEGEARTAFFDRLGGLASISAPHRGTPIARRLRGRLEDVIPFLFLASFAAKYDAQERGAWKKLRSVMRHFELGFEIAASSGNSPPKGSTLRAAVQAEDAGSVELRRFLREIIDDHPLVHELTPYAMNHLNAKLADGPGVALRVSNFITIAPPPRVHLRDFRLHHGLAPALRLLYGFAYEKTSLTPDEFGSLPTAPWIDGKMPPDFDFAKTAQDGVVPASSQSLDGDAVALVYADHLDVVGHFPGATHGGETVFDSGADFDDARMVALWKAVGAVLVDARPQAQGAA